jgi:hypothetical protein
MRFLKLFPILLGLVLFTHPVSAKDWSGYYERETEDMLYRLVLKENGALYFRYLYKPWDDKTRYNGVYLQEGDKFYTYFKDADSSEFGELKGELTEDGLKAEGYSSYLFFFREPVPRVEPFEISGKLSEQEREAMLQRLKDVMLRADLPETGVAEGGSVPIHQKARLYLGKLAPGQSAEVELKPGLGAWVQVTRGSVEVLEKKLEAGDGASIVDEPEALSFGNAGEEAAEFLLFELE